MKKRDLKKTNITELKKMLEELKKELMKYNSQVSTGTPSENPGKIRAVKKTIARIKMLLQKYETQVQGGK
ncbi:50S ribosomal protein L29 [Candidatus Woesearchaeota archaeon]|nr:50S ribosomal protein L29 [Candidatus Woesearchaeota archaeon]